MKQIALLFIVMLMSTSAVLAAVELKQVRPSEGPKLGTVVVNADSTITYTHTGPDVSDIYEAGNEVFDTLYLVARDLPDGVFSADDKAGQIIIKILPTNVGPTVDDQQFEIPEHTSKSFLIKFKY